MREPPIAYNVARMDPDDDDAPTSAWVGGRDRETVTEMFHRFAEVECRIIASPLYEAIALGVAGDAEMVELAAETRVTQPPPNLLFAAVQYLLLSGPQHRLHDYYPNLTAEPEPATESYGAFRDFVLAHAGEVRELLTTRSVQTNVVRRSICLLPAFALVAERGGGQPLAQVEVGASAGLNLLWERFHYEYGSVAWGSGESMVVLPTDRRGTGALPPLADSLSSGWSAGVDLNPVDITDADAVQWLLALVWPENVVLRQQLSAAIELARVWPPRVVAGDASALLPGLLEEAPAGMTLCVFATHTLYQFPRGALRTLLESMQTFSEKRPVYFISMEGTGDEHSELTLTTYERGERETVKLANCHPHGHWLEWLQC